MISVLNVLTTFNISSLRAKPGGTGGGVVPSKKQSTQNKQRTRVVIA